MLFSSMTFLFVFMPLVMAVYFLSKKEIRNYVLLIASIIFYAWGEPRYLAIMIITILVNYAGAILLDKHYSSRQRLWIVSLTIVLDLSFLFYFKYFNFVVDNINGVLATDFQLLDVIMPIGISFYIIQKDRQMLMVRPNRKSSTNQWIVFGSTITVPRKDLPVYILS